MVCRMRYSAGIGSRTDSEDYCVQRSPLCFVAFRRSYDVLHRLRFFILFLFQHLIKRSTNTMFIRNI